MRTSQPQRRKSWWPDVLIVAVMVIICVVMATQPLWAPYFPGLPQSPVSR